MRRSANPFIDAVAGVDGDVIGNKVINEKNGDLDKFIVDDNVEYYIIYNLYQFIKYFLV